MLSFLLLFLHLLSTGSQRAVALDPAMPFMEYLDQNHMVSLRWGFDKLRGNITFTLVVNTTGWVGFGFSPTGGMKGSDIVMGGLGPSGSYFADYHAVGNFMPLVDKKQSYTLLSMNESDGQTSMTVQRAIQSCDDQDIQITDQPIKLIYAYGLTDDITYHQARRGRKEVNLLNYMPRSTPSNPDYLNATVDNVTIPSNSMYNHCKIMKFPSLNVTHHIYLVEPVIEQQDLVRHMRLCRCSSAVMESSSKPCSGGDTGDTCLRVVAVWEMGGGGFELPENAGIPVGGEDSDVFYKLEIQYNNPTGETGRTDSSGLRLYYTSKLRQHDMGILSTGLMPVGNMKYSNPPKAMSYGVCNTTIFSQLLNPMPELQVFAVLLHTLQAGRKVRVGLYREGKQIDFFDSDDSFEKKQIIHLGNIKTIKQGDEIALECTSNHTTLSEMEGGTTEELCLAFLLYYPASQITSCIIYPNTTHPLMNSSMHQMNVTLHQRETAEYESMLTTVPQVQVISDDKSHFSVYGNGLVREMIKTPVVTCHDSNASSRLFNSWIVNLSGIMLLLLCVAIM